MRMTLDDFSVSMLRKHARTPDVAKDIGLSLEELNQFVAGDPGTLRQALAEDLREQNR